MHHDRVMAHKVYFEVTNHCNFRCDFCPIGESRRKKQHMDLALFQKGVQDIIEGQIADTIGFHILGEPLLYPKIGEAISYAAHKGLQTEMHTNGSLLTEERVRQLVGAGLDKLYISVQVFDAAEHASRGTALPFDGRRVLLPYHRRIMGAIRLIHSSDRMEEGTSPLSVVLCAMDTSTRRYFDIDKLMRVNGKRSTFIKNLSRLALDVYAATGKEVERSKVEEAFRSLNLDRPQLVRLDEHVEIYAQPLADWGNAFTARKVHPARFGACGYALNNVGVLSNGQVTICCADYDGQTSLGSLYTHSLAELLGSEEARAIRRGFRQNRIVHPHCQRCIGSPNRVKALFKGLISIYLFRWLDFQPARARQVLLFQA